MPWWAIILSIVGGALWTLFCIGFGAALGSGLRKTITIPDDTRGL